jgi:hypothetical protein
LIHKGLESAKKNSALAAASRRSFSHPPSLSQITKKLHTAGGARRFSRRSKKQESIKQRTNTSSKQHLPRPLPARAAAAQSRLKALNAAGQRYMLTWAIISERAPTSHSGTSVAANSFNYYLLPAAGCGAVKHKSWPPPAAGWFSLSCTQRD